MSDAFEQIRAELDQSGVPAALDRLVETLRGEKKHHELFEVLKMRVRHGLGLPLLYSDSGEDLDGARREKLEEGLIDACREVGMLLLDDGKIREGWMYMRPVGDTVAAAEKLASIEPDDNNVDELVEVSLHEGVDVDRGYAIVLERYGTCNAITTLESLVHGCTPQQQRGPVSQLVRHVYRELSDSVRAHVVQEEGIQPPDASLSQLVVDRDWMFGEHGYHIDTSHLSATVRFARVLEDPALLRLAWELTEYGRRLNAQFQYPGDEPFVDHYPSHALYFRALLREDVSAALDYFRQRAEALDVHEHGTAAGETYVALLARLGRFDEAIQATIELIPRDQQTSGLAPGLLDLSSQAGNYDRVLELFRERDDLLGYATGLMQAKLGR